MNYSIPPLSPTEALEFIASGTYHQDGVCGDGYDSCRCAEFVAGVALGRPGKCEDPGPYTKPHPLARTWAETFLAEALIGESILASPEPKQIPEV